MVCHLHNIKLTNGRLNEIKKMNVRKHLKKQTYNIEKKKQQTTLKIKNKRKNNGKGRQSTRDYV